MEALYEDRRRCFGCGACAAACPAGAVSMELDGEGFPYPVLDGARCASCGRCEAVCPAKAPPPRREGRFFAVRCREEAVLQSSSSGGAFTLLARAVTDRGGWVCGAVFDESFAVGHRLSRDFAPMRKSKYVQSDLSGCLAAVGEALGRGEEVLFTGTPCQCHAVRLLFPRGPLILASLVCRGVQPPGLWRDYAAWLGRDGPLRAYDFRDKRRRDDGRTVSYTVGEAETAAPMGEDRLSRMYNLGLTLRPSCYACPYARADNDFDFTLGDFWGVERVCPRFADGRGASLVIVRGPRAEALFAGAARDAEVVPCGPDQAVQPALTAPAKEPFLRKFLFRDCARRDGAGRCDIPLILKKYGAGP